MTRPPRPTLLPDVRELAASLAAAREQLHRARAIPKPAAWVDLQAAWHSDPERTPAVLVADLIAEAWVALAEETLARGGAKRSELALDLAEAAAEAGSGDPYLAARFHAAMARLHQVQGRGAEAHRELDRLLRLAEALEDPELLAQAEAARAALARALDARPRRSRARAQGKGKAGHSACDFPGPMLEPVASSTFPEGKSPAARDECKEDANA